MDAITVTFEVVTPAYAGSANKAETEGLRPPTLKALLRFWWRTMHADLSPQELYDAEAEIFGSTEYKRGKDVKGGQGQRIIPVDQNYNIETKTYDLKSQSPLYYMVYGADQHKDEVTRASVLHERVTVNSRFTFRIEKSYSWSEENVEKYWDEVLHALWLLSAFGGFGRRTRRGFGSIQLISSIPDFTDFTQCENPEVLKTALQTHLNKLMPKPLTTTPTFTAFSKYTKISVSPRSYTTWDEALIAAGEIFFKLRRMLGTTYNHTEFRKPVGTDFQKTNDFRFNDFSNRQATLDAAFGLPHNYQFSKNSPKMSYELYKDGEDKPIRRASPLFFKVIKIANHKYVPIVFWLSAKFIPIQNNKNDKDSIYEIKFIKDKKPIKKLNPPMNNAIEWLFDSQQVKISGDVAGVTTDRPFNGYKASGWLEVIL